MAKNVRVILQDGAGCGTASLAMILTAFHASRVPPRKFTQEIIDDEIRRINVFTAPVSAADLARRWGVAAKLCNNVDFKLLERMVRKGNVWQLLVDAPTVSQGNNANTNLHYVVADWAWEGLRSDFEPAMDDARFFQYAPDEFGEWVRIKDPHGVAYVIAFGHLQRCYWKNISYGLLPTGFSNFGIVYGDQEADLDVGESYHTFDASAALVLSTNTAELLTSLVHTAHLYPDALPKVIKNSVETILAATAFTIKTPGAVLNKVGLEGLKLGAHFITSDQTILNGTAAALIMPIAGTVWVASKPVEWLGDGFGYIVDLFD